MLDFVNAQVTNTYIGYGQPAIMATVGKMAELVYIESKSLLVRDHVRQILEGISPEDSFGEAKAVYDFVQANIRYTHDPVNYEFVQGPTILLQMIEAGETPIGDCDDMTTLGLTLLRSIGFRTGIEVASYNPSQEYEHVYGLVEINGEWLPFDAIKPEFKFGEWPNVQATARYSVMIKD